MANVIVDFKRAWRLTKLIRSSNLSDEDALEIEKINTLYIEQCRLLKNSLHKAKRSLNQRLESWKSDQGDRMEKLENSLTSSITRISQLLDASEKTLASRLGQVEQSSQTTMELVDNVREYVSKQADETRRWQEGYDWRILKNYLIRLISTMDDIETKLYAYKKEEKPEELIDDFDFIREAIENHLEEEGLLAFSPNVGDTVDTSREDVKGVKIVNKKDQIHGTIAEIIRKGYEIELGAETRVVRPAQVNIFKKEEK